VSNDTVHTDKRVLSLSLVVALTPSSLLVASAGCYGDVPHSPRCHLRTKDAATLTHFCVIIYRGLLTMFLSSKFLVWDFLLIYWS